MVSNHGQFPNADTNSKDACLVVGPMCRYASDLLPMFKVLAEKHRDQLQLELKVSISLLHLTIINIFSVISG